MYLYLKWLERQVKEWKDSMAYFHLNHIVQFNNQMMMITMMKMKMIMHQVQVHITIHIKVQLLK